MPTKTDDLTKLAATAARAEEQYRAEQAAADAAHAAGERRREAALREHDRARFDAYDDGALAQAERDAEARIRDAIPNDPVFSALLELQTVRIRRAYRHAEPTGDASRLGLGIEERRKVPTVARIPSEPNLEQVLRIVEQIADELVGEEEDARIAGREAAGDAAFGS